MALHKPRVMLAASALIAVLGAGVAAGSPAAASQHDGDKVPPYFETVRCPWPIPEESLDGWDTLCGYLHVPLKHAEPEGQTISLAVMILRASCSRVEPDPIIWLAGGPGASAIDQHGYPLAASPLRCHRDVLLMDQRGFGHSSPTPSCPLPDQGRLTDEEYDDLLAVMLRSCWLASPQGGGLDLSAFNTQESAADLEALRMALGYERVNLYGVSYGSYLALAVLRDFPSTVRAVVLDGVLPHGMAPRWESEAEMRLDAIRRVIAACEANDTCRRMYPHLFETLSQIVRELDAVPQGDDSGDLAGSLGDQAFLDRLFNLQYSEGWLPFLPAVIDLAGRSVYWPVVPTPAGPNVGTSAAYWSIVCTDSGNNPDSILWEPVCSKAGLGSVVFAASDRYLMGAGATMERQQVPVQPVSSPAPVLILSGWFDPITPPDYASFAAKRLPNSTVVEFPGLSHGAALTGECPDRILYEFYEAPLDTPDTSCVRDMPPVEFVGPEGLAKLLSGGERMLGLGILNYIYGLAERNLAVARVLIWSICILWALALGTIPHLLMAPLASLLSRILRRPQKPKPPAFVQLALLWQAMSTVFLTSLLAYLFVVLLLMLGGSIGPYSELDAVEPLILPLPLLVGVTTLLSLSSTWAGLRLHAWSRTRRLLHILFAFSAASLNLVLIGLGAIAGMY